MSKFCSFHQEPSIDLKEKELQFYAVGIGAKGLNEYAFRLSLYSEVVPEVGGLSCLVD